MTIGIMRWRPEMIRVPRPPPSRVRARAARHGGARDASVGADDRGWRGGRRRTARANSATLVALSALCDVDFAAWCMLVSARRLPALSSLYARPTIYTRLGTRETPSSQEAEVELGVGPHPQPPQTCGSGRRVCIILCLHHLPRTRLCVNACISPHTAPDHTGVRRPEMKVTR